jgi:DNA-binding transcriptional MocR family regulator
MFEHLKFTADDQPIYRQLAEAIVERIASGELAAGDRLPPQREMARVLRINLTTVTRAFSMLQQRGLVESRPGRGSVVTGSPMSGDVGFKSAPTDAPGLIDLSVNRPPTTAYLDALAVLLPRLAKDRRYAMLQDYHPPEGPGWAREAAAAWLAPVAGGGDAGRIMLVDGAQHGLACVLRGMVRPGDVMLADAVTYQGINALCRSLAVDLRGIPMDREGMRPDLFEAACAQWRPRAVFLVPSLHNPTAITMPEERRVAIMEAARRHNVIVIEDDVYGPLLDERPRSLACIEPELTVHVSGFSKCVAPGLRLGFVAAPRALLGDIAAALRIDCWSISPLTALIGSMMLEDGAIAQILGRQREELLIRQAVIREVLAGFDVLTGDTSTHAWLPLPEPWRGNVFARVARQRGVGLLAAEAFAVGREPVPHAVRINVAAARSRSELRRALEIIADLMKPGYLHLHDVV